MLIFHKPKNKPIVLIHTAIIVPTKKKSIVNNQNMKISKKIEKKVVKKGSSSAFTKGGDISFNEIFKEVHYNIKTQKFHQKKQLVMSRFKGVEANLKKIKFINNIFYIKKSGSVSDKEIQNIIAKKLSPIWNEVSNIVGEYAKINIIFNGKTKVYIIESNLPQDKQQLLIEEIEKLHFDKNFNITVKFITKATK